jgi:branched-chain amino acid transport system ATP-binding protein
LPLLELRGLGARYGDTQVLHDVSLTVEDGDFLAVLGVNGAGKTTTLRAISGTVRSSGEVILEGERLYRRTPEGMARRGVVHLPEGRGTFVRLSVLDNLRLGAWTQRGQSTRDLVHVFELFPVLYDRRRDRAGALSAVEQEMLALGRALMAKGRLLLVDEPSFGLAPAEAREIFATLRLLNERGTTVVAVEQNAGLALGAASHAVLLDEGRVVRAGAAGDLRADDAVARAFLGD